MSHICDYEGSRYRYEFWEDGNRQYEDLAERIALRNLLPPSGKRIIEVGAGFGRTVDMYQGYEQVILLDYARTQLEEAQKYLEHDDRFIFVVGDVYNLPFVSNIFDALVMIRVMHHLTNVPGALQELCRVISPKGTAVIEYASKRHWKSVARWLLKRQSWNPFNLEPHEFVELNIDFHPQWMHRKFLQAGFDIQNIRTVSHYRIPLLKNRLSPQFLARLDGWVQPTGRWLQYTPSVFLQATPNKQIDTSSHKANSLFQCPTCRQDSLSHKQDTLTCHNCYTRWAFQDGIYDFKTPLSRKPKFGDASLKSF